MQKIRWGIVGCGKIAAKMAAAMQSSARARLQAVASRSEAKASTFAEKWGAQQAYGSYEALYADAEVEAVYIATPHHAHAQIALACLEAGKAVLCEKPFATSAAEAAPVFALAARKQLFIMEALWTRFIPSYLKARQLAIDGALGEITAVIADFGFKAPYDPEGRLFNPVLAGGALLDVGIYPVFLAYTILGVPDSIQATMTPAPTGVDYHTSINFGYTGGAQASLTASFAAHQPLEAWIIGTEGRIKIHRKWHEQSHLTVIDHDQKETILRFDYQGNGFDHELEAVHDALQAGKTTCDWWSPENSIELSQTLDRIQAAW